MNEPNNLELMKEIDEQNVVELKKIFEEVGYISSKYGEEAQTAAFYIVLHMEADDVSFMKKYLKQMKKDLDGISPEYLALLTDRVRIYEDKDQLYGTQFAPIDPKGNQKHLKLMPIHKPDEVNKRRLEIGLDTLEEFIAWFEQEPGVTLVR